ncbi:MAG: sulfatase-like hydrolase/transferase [Anaerolineae bacterium]|nr:sulfatase-like hydrolase/transferase [Anaerolineae bacterium]
MQRPNILIIYTDQWRWDALGANGNPHVITPNLDRLAAEGVNFDHHFVQNPVCMPSRASFLTGQYPSTLGITHMGVPVPEDALTLPHLLRPYGYRSANIGKLHFLPHANRDHRIQHPAYGFDHLEISDEPGVYDDAYRAWVRQFAPDQMDYLSVGLPPNRAKWQTIMGVEDGAYPHHEGISHDSFKGAIPFAGRGDVTHSAFVGTQTCEFLRQQHPAGSPFLCVASFYAPHTPWVVPQRFINQYDPATLPLPEFPPEINTQRPAGSDDPDVLYSDAQLRGAKQGYYAMITEVDSYVGKMLDTLDEQGLAENTIVLFTSDHGEWLGDHLRYGKGYPGDDPVARVPLIVRWPGEIRNTGRTISEIMEAVNVLPTLLDCAGIQVPPHLQGTSFAAMLGGGDYAGHGSALMEFAGWKNLRTAEYRYLIHEDGREMLWDITRDPGEYRDVANNPDYAVALAEHRRRMIQRLILLERPLPRVWPY